MNERLCEIVAEPGRVEAWVAVRPPFEPKGWQLEFRNELRVAVCALGIPEGHLLVAEYTSAIRRPGVDVENVLLYNLGIGASAGRSIRFCWTLDEPPPAPSGAQHEHKLCYQVERYEPEPLGKSIAFAIGFLSKQSGELKPLDVWLALKHGTPQRYSESEHLGPFALRASLHTRRPRAAASVLKPLFDGAIAALQYDPDPVSAAAGARLLAMHCNEDVAWLEAALSTPGPLGPSRPLVRASHRGGLVWNPRDHDCLSGEIRVFDDERAGVSVEARQLPRIPIPDEDQPAFLRELVKLSVDVRFWASEGELETVTGYYASEYGRLLETTIDLGDERHAAMIFCAAANVHGYPHQMRPEEICARLGPGYEQRIDEIVQRLRTPMRSLPRRLRK